MKKQLVLVLVGLLSMGLLAGCSTLQQPVSGKSWSQRAAEEQQSQPFSSPTGSGLGPQ